MRLAAALLAASVLLLTGCTAAPATDPTASSPATAVPTSPVPTSAAATPTAAATATCETLIPPGTVSDFQELGWSYKEEPFMVVSTEIPGGLLCKWGNFSGAGGENVQLFGWAPISATASQQAQSDLMANGWQTIDTDEGVFLTENSDTAFATGEQGYGLTYQFGDGWVIFADTKQSLVLIERPGA